MTFDTFIRSPFAGTSLRIKLILELPVDFTAQLFGTWLTLKHLCKLEEAMCSAENRLRMDLIYEALVLGCVNFIGVYPEYVYSGNPVGLERQLDWLMAREIKVSSLRIGSLSANAIPKITSLIKRSKAHTTNLTLSRIDTSLRAIVASITRYCTRLQSLAI